MYMYTQTDDQSQLSDAIFIFLAVTEWKAQDSGMSKAMKDRSTLPSKIYQIKVNQETGSETNIAFGCAPMPSDLGMCPPKAEFSIAARETLITGDNQVHTAELNDKSIKHHDNKLRGMLQTFHKEWV